MLISLTVVIILLVFVYQIIMLCNLICTIFIFKTSFKGRSQSGLARWGPQPQTNCLSSFILGNSIFCWSCRHRYACGRYLTECFLFEPKKSNRWFMATFSNLAFLPACSFCLWPRLICYIWINLRQHFHLEAIYSLIGTAVKYFIDGSRTFKAALSHMASWFCVSLWENINLKISQNKKKISGSTPWKLAGLLSEHGDLLWMMVQVGLFILLSSVYLEFVCAVV